MYHFLLLLILQIMLQRTLADNVGTAAVNIANTKGYNFIGNQTGGKNQ